MFLIGGDAKNKQGRLMVQANINIHLTIVNWMAWEAVV